MNVPVDKTLRVTPMYRAHKLGCPPPDIALQNLLIIRARLEHIPQRATFYIVHDKIEMCCGLESTQQIGCPLRRGLSSPEQYVSFNLWRTLLIVSVLSRGLCIEVNDVRRESAVQRPSLLTFARTRVRLDDS